MAEKETKGFVFHLANDQNFSRIQLASSFNMETQTAIELSFNLKNYSHTLAQYLLKKMAIQLIRKMAIPLQAPL